MIRPASRRSLQFPWSGIVLLLLFASLADVRVRADRQDAVAGFEPAVEQAAIEAPPGYRHERRILRRVLEEGPGVLAELVDHGRSTAAGADGPMPAKPVNVGAKKDRSGAGVIADG